MCLLAYILYACITQPITHNDIQLLNKNLFELYLPHAFTHSRRAIITQLCLGNYQNSMAFSTCCVVARMILYLSTEQNTLHHTRHSWKKEKNQSKMKSIPFLFFSSVPCIKSYRLCAGQMKLLYIAKLLVQFSVLLNSKSKGFSESVI